MQENYLGTIIDFSSPVGEAALLAPDSVQWRVYKNPIALGIGGIAAVLLEFAEPRIRSGVWIIPPTRPIRSAGRGAPGWWRCSPAMAPQASRAR